MTDGGEKQRSDSGSDTFLRTLAAMAELHGVEVGITLSAGGILVSGLLVSETKFFEGMANEFLGAVVETGSQGAALFEQIFRQVATGFAEDARTLVKEGIDSKVLHEVAEATEYIHLRDAQYWRGGQTIPTREGVWWRGRLDKVAGFNFGTIGQEPAKPSR